MLTWCGVVTPVSVPVSSPERPQLGCCRAEWSSMAVSLAVVEDVASIVDLCCNKLNVRDTSIPTQHFCVVVAKMSPLCLVTSTSVIVESRWELRRSARGLRR